jgi:CheY-like chemotaxis protein
MQTSTGTSPNRKRRILVADDDQALRGLLVTALQKDGHEIVEAEDGLQLVKYLATAIAHLSGPQFDLVISDVRMPRWSGLDVLAGLRQTKGVPPILLITAFGDEQLHADAIRLGAVALLDKPFDVDHLRSIVSSTLG